MVDESITWVGSGTLYGSPVIVLGCQITCGTKQNWNIGFTPALTVSEDMKLSDKLNQIKANEHQLVIYHDAMDSSGGVCKGKYHRKAAQSHRMRAEMTHYHQGKKTQNDFIIVGGAMQYIPLLEEGTYHLKFKTLEWGEDCIKPKNTDTFKFKIGATNDPLNDTTNDQLDKNDDIETNLLLSSLVAIGSIITILGIYRFTAEKRIK